MEIRKLCFVEIYLDRISEISNFCHFKIEIQKQWTKCTLERRQLFFNKLKGLNFDIYKWYLMLLLSEVFYNSQRKGNALAL